MVVDHDHGCAVGPDSLAEQFPHPHHGGVEAANVDGGNGQDAVVGIEKHDSELLLLQEAHLQQEQVGHVRW
jgi:hypothetical protein